jgi:uncharacterized protein (TIGR03084 family)
VDVAEVLDDLIAEQGALDRVVSELDPADWQRRTPSPRWSVADQIGHLTYFDRAAALAITDPTAFVAHRDELVAQLTDELGVDDLTLGEFRKLDATDQLAAWRSARAALKDAARSLADADRVEWYGPSMGSKSFLTARLMEVWAHGQDVVDAVGGDRPATDRLRHIAQLGVITRGWSYIVRGEQPPPTDVRVELTAPSGDRWVWGPDDATDRITGPAEDFCLVVTQRRNVADTDLDVTGDSAADWMGKAQAFAGGPSTGPAPSDAS